MGLKQPRLRGDAYYEIVDEFVQAVMGRWPHAVLQVGGRGRQSKAGSAVGRLQGIAPTFVACTVHVEGHACAPVNLLCSACTSQRLLAITSHLLPALLSPPGSRGVQFEDFNIEHAAPLLERYRYSHVSGVPW